MQTTSRPFPGIKGITERFWRGARAGELWYQHCTACEAVVFPARIMCPACSKETLEWKQSEGRGTVYSFTVVHQTRQPFFAKLTPYVVALIDVEPGFRIMSNITGIAPDGVRIGMPVTVAFEELGDEFGVPIFQAAGVAS